MPRNNSVEAIPVPKPEAKKSAKKKRHLKLVEGTEEIQLKDSDLEEIEDLTHEAKEDDTDDTVELKDSDLEEIEDLTHEAKLEVNGVTELKDSDLEEIEDLTHEARRIRDEAAMKEARKNLEGIPDITHEAHLEDEGDRAVDLAREAARRARTRNADEVYPMDNVINLKKPKSPFLSRIKSWFGRK